MSFASETKKELTLIEADLTCVKAEVSALIRMNGSISFSVKPGTEMEFHFPFVVANADFEKICDYEYLTNNTFYLNLSQYPVENSIEVKV